LNSLERFDLSTCLKLNEWLRKDVKRIVIIPHVNPDGDAIGSTIGLNDVFKHAGFETQVIVPNDYPAYLEWLGSDDKPMVYDQNPDLCSRLIRSADVLFLLDFSDFKRLGKLEEIVRSLSTPIVLIDHHPDPKIETEYRFWDVNVSSTAELVYDFIVALGMEGHLKEIGANALLTGIIADTGSLSHNASRPGMYHVIAELINIGADKEKVNEALYNNFSEKRMKLLGYCLSEKMEVFPQFRTALIWLTSAELKRFNFQTGDTEGFVNYPLSIAGIVFTAFFMEKNGQIRLSFRSKGNFAVNEFSSAHFGGGGHRNASGGDTKLSMKEAISLFKGLLPAYAEQLNKDC